MPYNYIARFEEVGSGDVGPIGGKNASLGERRWLSNRAPSVKSFLAKQISARAAASSWRELAAAER
jgi:hypothetical protein